jgi:hypothetical protein
MKNGLHLSCSLTHNNERPPGSFPASNEGFTGSGQCSNPIGKGIDKGWQEAEFLKLTLDTHCQNPVPAHDTPSTPAASQRSSPWRDTLLRRM